MTYLNCGIDLSKIPSIKLNPPTLKATAEINRLLYDLDEIIRRCGLNMSDAAVLLGGVRSYMQDLKDSNVACDVESISSSERSSLNQRLIFNFDSHPGLNEQIAESKGLSFNHIKQCLAYSAEALIAFQTDRAPLFSTLFEKLDKTIRILVKSDSLTENQTDLLSEEGASSGSWLTDVTPMLDQDLNLSQLAKMDKSLIVEEGDLVSAKNIAGESVAGVVIRRNGLEQLIVVDFASEQFNLCDRNQCQKLNPANANRKTIAMAKKFIGQYLIRSA